MRHPDGAQIAVAFDQLVNTLLGGWADETLSARAWRHKLDGRGHGLRGSLTICSFGKRITARLHGRVS